MVTTVPIERENVGVHKKKYLFMIIQTICIVLMFQVIMLNFEWLPRKARHVFALTVSSKCVD